MVKILAVPLSRTMLVAEQPLGPTTPTIRSGRQIAEMLTPVVGLEPAESFFAISLDSRRRVIQAVRVSSGTLTQAMAHPREVFRAAIVANAAGVIVAHNHPSGDPTPSFDDHALTRRIREAGDLLNIPVLDHVIVTMDVATFFSYSEQGWPRA